MKKEMEQKKEYVKPEMFTYEIKADINLLQCSGCNDNTIDVDFIK